MFKKEVKNNRIAFQEYPKCQLYVKYHICTSNKIKIRDIGIASIALI